MGSSSPKDVNHCYISSYGSGKNLEVDRMVFQDNNLSLAKSTLDAKMQRRDAVLERGGDGIRRGLS
jgi:hypothetical protein